jgi:hypothetical protein
MKLPKLIATTREKRRIYPIKLAVNIYQLDQVSLSSIQKLSTFNSIFLVFLLLF